MIDIDVLCQWPISYLQDKLGGIITKNLVIIGGSSGFGKTTISRIITNSAIEQDCPVVLYSLEDVPDSFVTDAVRQEYVNDTGRFLDLQDFALEYKAYPQKFKKYQQIVYEKHHKTGMENQRGKDTGMQATPTTPTLSDQKKPFFPTERKAHPQTTPSLLPKAVHHFPY